VQFTATPLRVNQWSCSVRLASAEIYLNDNNSVYSTVCCYFNVVQNKIYLRKSMCMFSFIGQALLYSMLKTTCYQRQVFTRWQSGRAEVIYIAVAYCTNNRFGKSSDNRWMMNKHGHFILQSFFFCGTVLVLRNIFQERFIQPYSHMMGLSIKQECIDLNVKQFTAMTQSILRVIHFSFI